MESRNERQTAFMLSIILSGKFADMQERWKAILHESRQAVMPSCWLARKLS
jgi:hypothetical protein